MTEIQSNPTKTVLTISVGIAIIHIFTSLDWLLLVSIGIGIIGVVSAKLSRIIEIGWFYLARLMSKIFPKIILSLIYFLVLWPVSALNKLFGKPAIDLKEKKSSTFKTVNKTFTSKSLENPW